MSATQETGRSTGHESIHDSAPLSDRKRRDPVIQDYLLPAPLVEFAEPTPIPIFQPSYLTREEELAAVPHINNGMLSRADREDAHFNHESELVRIRLPNGQVRLAIQSSSPSLIARHVFDEKASVNILEDLSKSSPDAHGQLTSENIIEEDTVEVVDGWQGWRAVENNRRDHETFNGLAHVLKQAPSGAIRIENQRTTSTYFVTTGNTTQARSLDRDRLESSIFTCIPEQHNGKKAVRVEASMPWRWSDEKDKDGGSFDTVFYVFEDGVVVPDEEVTRTLERARTENRVILREVAQAMPYSTEEAAVRYKIASGWDRIADIFRRRDGDDWDRGRRLRGGPYSLKAFGQEMAILANGEPDDGHSIRVFDAVYPEPTVRTQEEVDAEIYMTQEEASETEREEGEFKRRWIEEILPKCAEWTEGQAAAGAEHLRTHRVDAVDLVKSKLLGDTRIVTIGMLQHPHFDHLPFEIMEAMPDLDFIAVEVRDPEDERQSYQDDKEGFVSIDLGGGMHVEMSHEDAKRKHPDQYRDPDRHNPAWDNVIAAAKDRGVHVIYTAQGDEWKDMNRLGAEAIARYMREHPNSRGVNFSTLLPALKWPGYETHEDLMAVGFNRPFVDIYSIANAQYSDTTIRTAASYLEEAFPGQTYSAAQFVMPKGFGKEGRNLRSSVGASGINERFALDNIAESPFAEQWYLFSAFPEFESWPKEELWEAVGPYFGPVEVRWGALFDGVIIYPSDKPLPTPPSVEEMMAAAAKYIGGMIKDIGSDS